MLTVVCFVFRGKAGGGSDENADSGVLYLRGDHLSHRPSLGHSYPATSLPVSKT